jgi:hypothetical protein
MPEEKTIEISFKFLQNGWRSEDRSIPISELQELLKDATVVSLDFYACFGTTLQGLILRLKDGRKCELTEENNTSYECSSVGWINVFISEDWSE